MLGKIIAFLAVAASVAFATTCGPCYPGYGGPVSFAGIYNNGFYGSRVLSGGCINSDALVTPAFRATVGGPEVISSCENSMASPVVSARIFPSGLYGSGYGFGGCHGNVIATAC